MKDTQPAHSDCQVPVVGAWPPGHPAPEPRQLAKGNGPLVQRAAAIAANLDLPIASAADAEADLKLSPGLYRAACAHCARTHKETVMQLNEVAALLQPEPLPLETGYERLPDGVLHVAVRTDMHNCTGEMFEWWFRWRCDTQKYTWWHPVDHLFSTWQGELSDSTHVGSEHVATEELTGQPATDLLVQFRDPAEFFDPRSYREARDSGKISCAVTARAGLSHSPKRQPDGAVIGGRVLHIGRDTAWGLALRSHFYLGQDLPASGASPLDLEREVTTELGTGLLQHAYNEFTFLSRFLPSLHVAEHRDKHRPVVPW